MEYLNACVWVCDRNTSRGDKGLKMSRSRTPSSTLYTVLKSELIRFCIIISRSFTSAQNLCVHTRKHTRTHAGKHIHMMISWHIISDQNHTRLLCVCVCLVISWLQTNMFVPKWRTAAAEAAFKRAEKQMWLFITEACPDSVFPLTIMY